MPARGIPVVTPIDSGVSQLPSTSAKTVLPEVRGYLRRLLLEAANDQILSDIKDKYITMRGTYPDKLTMFNDTFGLMPLRIIKGD